MSISGQTSRSVTLKFIAQAVLLYAVLSLFVHAAIRIETVRRENELENRVVQIVLGKAARLEAELNANIFLANGLVAYVAAVSELRPVEVEKALKTLYETGRHIRNVGLAPGNRLSFVYPLEGNRKALGLYYPDHPTQWDAVKKAIDSRETVLAGPVNLQQGGRGLICRTPVFLENDEYWGILSLVLDAGSVFETVGLNEQGDGLDFALRGQDGAGASGEIIFGKGSIFEERHFSHVIPVPGGEWILAGKPSLGWDTGASDLTLVELFLLCLSMIPAAGLYAYQKSRYRVTASERRLRAFMETTRDSVVVINESGIVQEFNPASEKMFGYEAREILNASINRLMPDAIAIEHDGFIRNPRREGTRQMSSERQVFGRHKDGTEFPVEISVGEAMSRGRKFFVGVIRDITERKAFEEKLLELANTDGLTGVLNRRAFMTALDEAWQMSCRHSQPISVLMIDADHFKNINDTWGHQVGDEVLILLARSIQDCLRSTDRLGRLGGEEFAVVLPQTSEAQARIAAERVGAAIRAVRLKSGDGELAFTVSIGIGSENMASTIRMSPEQLLHCADEALYCAKSDGRDCWRSYAGEGLCPRDA